jgi:hypothetical protein
MLDMIQGHGVQERANSCQQVDADPLEESCSKLRHSVQRSLDGRCSYAELALIEDIRSCLLLDRYQPFDFVAPAGEKETSDEYSSARPL